MTKTITSQSNPTKHYFLTIDDTCAVDCTCPDRLFRHHACKHMTGFETEVARAAAFLALRALYDVRSEAQKAARREAYCIEFNIY